MGMLGVSGSSLLQNAAMHRSLPAIHAVPFIDPGSLSSLCLDVPHSLLRTALDAISFTKKQDQRGY